MGETFLQTQIDQLLSREQRLEWLVQLGVRAASVANFGCAAGGETLALMWALGASQATGLDEDEGAIRQAQDTLRSIQDTVKGMGRCLRHDAEGDQAGRNESVLDFFKRDLLQAGGVSFLVRDMTAFTGLPSDHYDVAYCDFVLYHIWHDAARENAPRDTAFAVSEMARVTRPGGAVVVSEPIGYFERPGPDFTLLFQVADLEIEYEEEREIDGLDEQGVVARYLCRKSV